MAADVIEWPACRDVMRQLNLSQPYVHKLIHTGRLRAVRTRLGYLIDPQSVDEFEAKREAHLRARES